MIHNGKVSVKAQAALEFLMTYGWAILVVIVAVGAIAYFGVLDPTQFVPETCILEPGVMCLNQKIETDKITLSLASPLQTIIINSVSVKDCSSSGLTTEIPQGESAVITIGDSCTNGESRSKFKGTIIIDYTEKSTNAAKRITGTLQGKVQ